MRIDQFNAARLAEDKTAALACIKVSDQARMQARGQTPPRWTDDERHGSSIRDEAGILRVRHTWAQERAHIVRQDPVRTLRTVDALTRILDRHAPNEHGMCQTCPPEESEIPWIEIDDCLEQRDIASIWNDHPDYERRWCA